MFQLNDEVIFTNYNNDDIIGIVIDTNFSVDYPIIIIDKNTNNYKFWLTLTSCGRLHKYDIIPHIRKIK